MCQLRHVVCASGSSTRGSDVPTLTPHSRNPMEMSLLTVQSNRCSQCCNIAIKAPGLVLPSGPTPRAMRALPPLYTAFQKKTKNLPVICRQSYAARMLPKLMVLVLIFPFWVVFPNLQQQNVREGTLLFLFLKHISRSFS